MHFSAFSPAPPLTFSLFQEFIKEQFQVAACTGGSGGQYKGLEVRTGGAAQLWVVFSISILI